MKAPDTNRLVIAMLLYGVLAASAFFTLSGELRIFVLILFAGLAAKTWISFEREKLESNTAPQTDSDFDRLDEPDGLDIEADAGTRSAQSPTGAGEDTRRDT